VIYAIGFGIPVLAGAASALTTVILMKRAALRDRISSIRRPPNYYLKTF
jgi:hypothetical protein